MKFKSEQTDLIVKQDMLSNVAVITAGEAKGHILELESGSHQVAVGMKFLNDLVEYSAEKSFKVHVGHITMCGDSFTQQIGVIKNLYLQGDKVIGDIEFIRNEKDNAEIDKILAWANKAPDMFGLSIDFECSDYSIEDGVAIPLFKALNSVDIVGYPAANENGLFSVTPQMKRYLQKLAKKEYSELMNDVSFVKLLDIAESKVSGTKNAVKELFSDPLENRSFEKLEEIIKNKTKTMKFASHEVVGGAMLTTDELKVGSPVLIDGVPAKAGEYELLSGDIVVVDENSVVTEIRKKELEAEIEIEQKLSAIKLKADIAKLTAEKEKLTLEAAQLKLNAQKNGMPLPQPKVIGNLPKFDRLSADQRNVLATVAYFKLGKPVSMERAERQAKARSEFSSAFNVLKEFGFNTQSNQFASPDVTGMISRNPFVFTDEIKTLMYEMYAWYNTFGNQTKIASTNNQDTFTVAKSFATVDPIYGSDYLVDGGTDCSFENQVRVKAYNRQMTVDKKVLNYELCPAQFADVFQGRIYNGDFEIPMEQITVGYLIERMFNTLEQIHWQTLISVCLSNDANVTDVADVELQKYITGTYNGTTQGALVNFFTNFWANMPTYLKQNAQEGKYQPVTFMPFATLDSLRNDFRQTFKYNMQLPEIISGYDALVPAEMANIPMGMKQNTILTQTGTSTALYPQLITLDPQNVMWAEHFGATPFYSWISDEGNIRMKATVWAGSNYIIPNEVFVSRQS